MKTNRQFSYLLFGALAVSSGFAEDKIVETRIGKLEFTHDFANGYPTRATVEKLYDERDFQRARQAYLWLVKRKGPWTWACSSTIFGLLQNVARGRIEHTQGMAFSAYETAGVGQDDATPVSTDYKERDNSFTGKIPRSPWT